MLRHGGGGKVGMVVTSPGEAGKPGIREGSVGTAPASQSMCTVNLTVCQSICPTTIKVEYHNALYHTQICVTLSMSSCCT
jgi:hypothetical protein